MGLISGGGFSFGCEYKHDIRMASTPYFFVSKMRLRKQRPGSVKLSWVWFPVNVVSAARIMSTTEERN